MRPSLVLRRNPVVGTRLIDHGRPYLADMLDLQVWMTFAPSKISPNAVNQAMVDVEDRIAALVPTSPAGAAALLRLLRQWGRDYEWNEPLEELADELELLAGLERIGEGARPGR